MNELRTRGVEDVLIAVVDGLKGFPEAITAVFPETQVQTCIVHLIRSSLAFVSYKDRKAVAAALKEVYRATDADAGQAALEAFAASTWGRKYEAIAAAWRRHWAAVIPFFAFPEEVRRIISTTHVIEALNAKLRRAVRARGHFPTDESAIKLLFLVLRQALKRVEDAATGMGYGESPVRHSLRRPFPAGMMNPAHTRKFWQSLSRWSVRHVTERLTRLPVSAIKRSAYSSRRASLVLAKSACSSERSEGPSRPAGPPRSGLGGRWPSWRAWRIQLQTMAGHTPKRWAIAT
jgi:hypothetical protein